MLTQNVIFRANSQQHSRAQSKNLYCSKRDVSATVDMTSSRFFNGSTAISSPQFNIPAMNTKIKIALFVEKHLSATSL